MNRPHRNHSRTSLGALVALLVVAGAAAPATALTPTPTSTPPGAPTPTPTATLPAVRCRGDCDEGGAVDRDDLVKLLGIALGERSLAACGSGDADHDGAIGVGELVTAINAAAHGCPTPPARPFLVRDIFPGPGGSFPHDLVDVDGTLFFVATDGSSGFELWKSDGSAAGTRLVRDINPADSSSPRQLTNVNGTLFFTADDGGGERLWKSDGSTAGTKLVKNIESESLTAVGNTLFFLGLEDLFYAALWKSDGTAAGTGPLTAPFSQPPQELVGAAGTLFFVADDEVKGVELWKSDGTVQGTGVVKDICPGACGSSPMNLTNVGGALFFTASAPLSGRELWKSDGTIAGTKLVRDITPGPEDSFPFLPSADELINVGGTLFFTLGVGDGFQLWRSDGTEGGTRIVTDLSAVDSSTPGQPTGAGGTLFFTFKDGIHGTELWKSDGTPAGTGPVKDINPGPDDSFATEAVSFHETLTNANGRLIFGADDGRSGTEPWASDGTADGTFEVGDIASCGASSFPVEFTVSGANVFFSANDERSESDLWAVPLSALVPPRTPQPTPSPCPTATPTVHARTETIQTLVGQSENGKLYYLLGFDGEGIVVVTSLAISVGTLQSINESLRPPDTVLTSVTGTIGDLPPLGSITRTPILRIGASSSFAFVPDGNGEVQVHDPSGFDQSVRFGGAGTVPVQPITTADSCAVNSDCLPVPAAATTEVVRVKREATGGTVRVKTIVFPNPPGTVTASSGPTCAGSAIPCDPLDPLSVTCGGGPCAFGGEVPHQNVTLDDTVGSQFGNPDSQGDLNDGFVLINSTDADIVSIVVFMLDGASLPTPPMNAGASGFLVDRDWTVIDAIGSN